MADLDDTVLLALSRMGKEPFSTHDFIEQYKVAFPSQWAELVNLHGVGGKGSGHPRSVNTYIAVALNNAASHGELTKLNYGPAPKEWGSHLIRYWCADRNVGTVDNDTIFPDEIEEELREGVGMPVLVNRYERNPKARRLCIEHYGLKCQVCEMDFAQRYGELGSNFIHVHHLNPRSEQDESVIVDPIADLRPVCPNCHAMVHHKNPILTIEELRSIVQAQM